MEQRSSREFEQRVIRPLRHQARRLRLHRFIRGCTVVAWVVFVCLSLQLLLDWSLRLRWDMRAALLGVIVVGVVAAVWRYVIAPQRVRFGVADMAAIAEKRFPSLNALLISAVDFHAGHIGAPEVNSPELAGQVISQAARRAPAIRFGDLLNARPLRRAVVALAIVPVAVTIIVLSAPEVVGTWFDRNLLLADVHWPKRTRILVDGAENGVLRGAVGDDFEIRAHVADGYVVPRQVEILYEPKSGKAARETMTGVGERGFRITIPRLREDLRFRLAGGDDVTAWFRVELSERPRVETATLTVEPPAYMKKKTVTFASGQRAVELYPGSRLRIHIACSKPVVRATLMAAAEPIADAEPDGDGHTVTVTPTKSDTYHFELTDDVGLTNVRPVRFSVRLLHDEAPKVKLTLPNVGNMVTQNAVLPVHAEFTDDLGMADAAVLYHLSSAGDELQPIDARKVTPYDMQFLLRFEWPVADCGAPVGEQVSVVARAHDFDDVNGPNVGESSTTTFRIVTGDELLAELNRREQEFRRQFERVVESQERVRGDLLTVLGGMADYKSPAEFEVELAPLERRQRQIVSQSNIIRQQFEQVLAEMMINRLDNPDVHARLGDRIIAPLAELVSRDLSDAADQMRRLARTADIELARQMDPLQARIGEKMQSVLDSMLKWEGFQEVVNMVREIARLQRELQQETHDELDRQAGDVFEK